MKPEIYSKNFRNELIPRIQPRVTRASRDMGDSAALQTDIKNLFLDERK